MGEPLGGGWGQGKQHGRAGLAIGSRGGWGRGSVDILSVGWVRMMRII